MFGKKGAHLERPFKFLCIDGAFLVQITNGLAHIAFIEMLVKVWEPVQSLAERGERADRDKPQGANRLNPRFCARRQVANRLLKKEQIQGI